MRALGMLSRNPSLFGQFKAYAGTVGTLGQLADGLNSSSVADLAFLLQEVGHLRGVKHQTHSLLGLCDVAFDGLGSRLECDFAVLGVIGIGALAENLLPARNEKEVLLRLIPMLL